MTKCPVCALTYFPNPNAVTRCVAKHGTGVCCHYGNVMAPDDGPRYFAVPWPDCVLVPVVKCESHWLPAERSNEAVGCPCPPDAIASVLLVERPGLTNTVLRCLRCGDTRVIRSVVPK